MSSFVQRMAELKQELPAARYNKLTSRLYASRNKPIFYLSTKSPRERKLVYLLAKEHDLHCTKEYVDKDALFCHNCERLYFIINITIKQLKYDIQYDTVCPSCKSVQHSESLDSMPVHTGEIQLSHEPPPSKTPTATKPKQRVPMATIDDWMQYVKRVNCVKQ